MASQKALGSLRISRRYLSKVMDSFSENSLKVIHRPDAKEFTIELPPKLPEDSKSSQAVLQYDWLDRNTVDLIHTGVPEHYQRRGIAKILAKNAIDHFLDKNIKMKITCTYLIKFVKDTNYRSLAETHCSP